MPRKNKKTRIRRSSRRVKRRASRRVLRKVKTYYGGVRFFDNFAQQAQQKLQQAQQTLTEQAAKYAPGTVATMQGVREKVEEKVRKAKELFTTPAQ